VEILVFDNGPLSHFARENWLGVLKAIVGDRRALIPDTVVVELERGARTDPRIQAVLDAGWLERHQLVAPAEVAAFAKYSQRLVSRGRNVGESAVLAVAETMPGIAVVDDGAARRAAEDHGVALRPTLALLCEAIHGGLLTVSLVSTLADDLLTSSYRLPFGPGGFKRWAEDNGLV
jgi:predicted nucleic acid-binding protein